MRIRYNICFILIFILSLTFTETPSGAEISVGEAVTAKEDHKVEETPLPADGQRVFGDNLFTGNFKQKSLPHFDPNYRITIGDSINLKIWGAVELELDAGVDSQGNLFIPKVGTVTVAGVSNGRLIDIIRAKIAQKYNSKVFVYANVANYQPVAVFVTGSVNRPGLYQGLASDSVLQFIDKANGINLDYGSFRNIGIVRDNREIKRLDLYDFLNHGKMDFFQFHNGDAIVVDELHYRFAVSGDVKRPYLFELTLPVVSLEDLLALALPNTSATNVTITRWKQNNRKQLQTYSIDKSGHIPVKAGDHIEVFADHTRNKNRITISGEHQGLHTLLVDKAFTLGDLIQRIKLTPQSDVQSIQLFRKSVAEHQKQLLLAKLNELETLVLTTASATKDEALMRNQEKGAILTFIERARKTTPKGQIIINEKTDYDEIVLEDGDQIHLPNFSNLVLVQGEVAFPGAHTHVHGQHAADYIALSGDFGERANTERVLLIRRSGKALKLSSKSALKRADIRRGDALLVMPKLEGKHLQITKDITQILFQIAVTTGVVLAL